MNPTSSPQCPPSFDLHSEVNGADTYSDDIQALDILLAESTARKNREGVVIQHRAWRTFEEAFRSEEDHNTGISPNCFPPANTC
jgi:chromosome transmission fidelity protein 18